MDEKISHNELPLSVDRRALMALLSALGLGELAQAQDATITQPTNYRTVLENEWLRVIEVRARPGMGVCGEGMHSHPAHLTVVLADGKVKVKLPAGKTITQTAALGDVFWSEAETHEVENISGRDSRALLIELKPRKKA